MNLLALLSLCVCMYLKLFIYSFSVLGLGCCTSSSLVVVSGGYSLVEVCVFLTEMTSLVAEHRLEGAQASAAVGSVVVAHGFSCPTVCGIFPDQGSNLRPLHWQVDS